MFREEKEVGSKNKTSILTVVHQNVRHAFVCNVCVFDVFFVWPS